MKPTHHDGKLADTRSAFPALTLYRHFPSKTRMFDSLIEFIEDSLITRINLILKMKRKNTSTRFAPDCVVADSGFWRTQPRPDAHSYRARADVCFGIACGGVISADISAAPSECYEKKNAWRRLHDG